MSWPAAPGRRRPAPGRRPVRLVGGLTRYLLGLSRGLTGRVLRLLGSLARRPILVGSSSMASAASTTSLTMIRPSLPVPSTFVRSTPRSFASRRAASVASISPWRLIWSVSRLATFCWASLMAILHGRVVVHQLLKHRLEGFLASARDLIGQALQRGAVLLYLLLERLRRITEVLLSQVHRPLLDLLPGLLDALVQPLQCLRLSFGHLLSSLYVLQLLPCLPFQTALTPTMFPSSSATRSKASPTRP